MGKILVIFVFFSLFLISSISHASPISSEDAQKIALQHAKISEQEAEFIKIEQEYNNGIILFEVEFWKDHVEYEYKINIGTGEIVKYSQERNRTSFTPAAPNQQFLTAEKIKQIAVNHAGIKEDEVHFIKISQEFQYGYSSYELKFLHNSIEYKYEIDAVNGEILEFSVKKYQQ